MRLIDADKIEAYDKYIAVDTPYEFDRGVLCVLREIDNAPTVDAIKVDTLHAWLIEIAMNNTDNYLGDACEVIMGRLNGLRQFAKDRKELR